MSYSKLFSTNPFNSIDNKSETAAICRHSEGNNNFIPKNLLLNNQEIDNSRNLRHSERIAKNPADYYNTSKLKGILMKNFSETYNNIIVWRDTYPAIFNKKTTNYITSAIYTII